MERTSSSTAARACTGGRWKAEAYLALTSTFFSVTLPGAVIAIQTFGDILGFNPHCHVLVTDGCFYGKGMFRVAPPLDLKKLEAIFRHKVFKMLLAKGRITKDLIAMLSNWRHSGFQVFCGQRLFPQDETGMENLPRSIIRASFSQERMQSKVVSLRQGLSVYVTLIKSLSAGGGS